MRQGVTAALVPPLSIHPVCPFGRPGRRTRSQWLPCGPVTCAEDRECSSLAGDRPLGRDRLDRRAVTAWRGERCVTPEQEHELLTRRVCRAGGCCVRDGDRRRDQDESEDRHESPPSVVPCVHGSLAREAEGVTRRLGVARGGCSRSARPRRGGELQRPGPRRCCRGASRARPGDAARQRGPSPRLPSPSSDRQLWSRPRPQQPLPLQRLLPSPP